MEVEVEEELGNLRSTTATVYENVTLYHKSFAIIQCRSRPTIWAKYSKNKLVRAVLRAKTENERFSVACLRCRQNLKFGDFTSSLC